MTVLISPPEVLYMQGLDSNGPLDIEKSLTPVTILSSQPIVVAANPQMLVDLPKRTTDLLPFAFEALGVLMELGALTVAPDGRLQTVREGVRKGIDGTSESISCQRVAKFLGREFAQIGDRVTIYTTLGVRP